MRPTCTVMLLSLVRARSASYLKAMAQRGAFDVLPVCSRRLNSSSLITAPSVSKSKSWRIFSNVAMAWRTPASLSASQNFGTTGRPILLSQCNNSDCATVALPPSTAPSP